MPKIGYKSKGGFGLALILAVCLLGGGVALADDSPESGAAALQEPSPTPEPTPMPSPTPSPALSQTQTSPLGFASPWTVLSAGGDHRGSASYALDDTASQPTAIGASQSANFSLGAGFWYGMAGLAGGPGPTPTPTPTPGPGAAGMWNVLASSGGQSSSANYVLSDTTGQPSAIGPSQGGQYSLGAGYWYGVAGGAAGPTPTPTPTPTPEPTPTPTLTPTPVLSATFPAGWNMFSIPVNPVNPDFAAVLGDDIAPLYVYWYDPGAGGYRMWSSDNHAFEAGLGRGYWVKALSDTVVDAEGTLAPDAPFVILLVPGWRQLGNPFNYAVNWGDAQVRNPAINETVSIVEAHNRGWVSQYMYAYDPAAGGYRMYSADDGQLDPWNGYWVKALVEADLIIPNTPAP